MKRSTFSALFAVLLVLLSNPTAFAWVTEVLDQQPTGGSGGEGSAVAVDSTGAIHISSINQSFHDLQYTTNASGAWKTILLDWIGEDSITSIAVDSADKVHISYGTGSFLKYATNASGDWVTTHVHMDIILGGLSHCTSIAVDSADKAHISYVQDTGLYGYGHEYNLRHATNASGPWVTEPVELDVGAALGLCSIAVDGSDKVHISYPATDGIRHATNASGPWVIETVDTDGLYPSTVVDSSDNLHISYSGGAGIKHATNASGPWVTETVDTDGTNPSIVVDGSDNLHISYKGAAGIKHATNASGPWVTETLVPDGHRPSIAVDSSDKVHISYTIYGHILASLGYATNASGAWVMTALDSVGDLGLGSSVALDGSAKVHISYCDDANDTLKVASNASGAWVTETVGPAIVGPYQVESTSIALDDSGNVHISYPEGSAPTLKYATNASGAWVTETVDPGYGSRSSIAVDGQGKIHIGYGNLKYATNASGAWVTETVGAGELWEYLSIALDHSDRVHAAYSDFQHYQGGSLHYVTNAAGAWATEIVDSAEGYYCSIAVDSSDKVHISYTGLGQYQKVATNVSGAWVKEAVDSALDHIGVSSIALDAADQAHISYIGKVGFVIPFVTLPALKYATNASGRWETWVASDNEDPSWLGYDNSIAVGATGILYISHNGSDGTLLLTSGTPPPPSSGWGPASTVASESRGDSAFPNYLLFLTIPVGIILIRKNLRSRQRLSR